MCTSGISGQKSVQAIRFLQYSHVPSFPTSSFKRGIGTQFRWAGFDTRLGCSRERWLWAHWCWYSPDQEDAFDLNLLIISDLHHRWSWSVEATEFFLEGTEQQKNMVMSDVLQLLMGSAVMWAPWAVGSVNITFSAPAVSHSAFLH